MENERSDGYSDDAPPPPPLDGGEPTETVTPAEPTEPSDPSGFDDLAEPGDSTEVVEPVDSTPTAQTALEPAFADEPAAVGGEYPVEIDAMDERDRRMGTGAKVSIALVVTLAVLSLLYVGAAWYVRDKVPNNTFVDGISIGGLASSSAVNKINEEFAARPVVPVAVSAVDRTTELAPDDLGLYVDAPATVSPLVGFSLYPQDLWHHVTGLGNVVPTIAIDSEKAEAALVSALPLLEVEPVEGAIGLADGQSTVTDAVVGVRVDVPASIEVITSQWLEADDPIELSTIADDPDINQEDLDRAMSEIVDPLLSGPVTVTVGDASAELTPSDLTAVSQLVPEGGQLVLEVDGESLQLALVEKHEGFTVDGEDARIVLQNGSPTIIPSKEGQAIDPGELGEAVHVAALSRESRNASVEFHSHEPEFTTTDAEELKVVEKISEFSTPLTSDSVRTQNLITGTDKINNTLLKPGDEFSLIDALGPITYERGFVSSGVVENGFLTNAMGGGLSQLSTTTYNAAYFAGMDILEHKPHTRWFSRYPEGRESTMWAPDVDMRFKNNTPYGVLVQAWVEGGRTWVRFWSTEYYTVETYTSGRYNITQPKIQYNTSPECISESGGQSGFSVDGWRKRYLGENLVDTWNWSWTYSPWNIVRCGSEAEWNARNQTTQDESGD